MSKPLLDKADIERLVKLRMVRFDETNFVEALFVSAAKSKAIKALKKAYLANRDYKGTFGQFVLDAVRSKKMRKALERGEPLPSRFKTKKADKNGKTLLTKADMEKLAKLGLVRFDETNFVEALLVSANKNERVAALKTAYGKLSGYKGTFGQFVLDAVRSKEVREILKRNPKELYLTIDKNGALKAKTVETGGKGSHRSKKLFLMLPPILLFNFIRDWEGVIADELIEIYNRQLGPGGVYQGHGLPIEMRNMEFQANNPYPADLPKPKATHKNQIFVIPFNSRAELAAYLNVAHSATYNMLHSGYGAVQKFEMLTNVSPVINEVFLLPEDYRLTDTPFTRMRYASIWTEDEFYREPIVREMLIIRKLFYLNENGWPDDEPYESGWRPLAKLELYLGDINLRKIEKYVNFIKPEHLPFAEFKKMFPWVTGRTGYNAEKLKKK
jgi:DNA-binding TFAR19-related protein (PDSD5 family)